MNYYTLKREVICRKAEVLFLVDIIYITLQNLKYTCLWYKDLSDWKI